LHGVRAFSHASQISQCVRRVYGNEELGVVSELMVADIKRLDDASDWSYIGGEQQRPQKEPRGTPAVHEYEADE